MQYALSYRDAFRSLSRVSSCDNHKINTSLKQNMHVVRFRDRNRLGRPAGRVAGRVEILRPAGQAG